MQRELQKYQMYAKCESKLRSLQDVLEESKTSTLDDSAKCKLPLLKAFHHARMRISVKAPEQPKNMQLLDKFR